MFGFSITKVKMKALLKRAKQQKNHTHTGKRFFDMKEVMKCFSEEKYESAPLSETSVSVLDESVLLANSEYAILRGSPGAGKTALALKMALEMAEAGQRVLYVTLEANPQTLMDRLMTIYCGLNYNNVRRHNMRTEWEKVSFGAKKLADYKLSILCAGGKSIEWIKKQIYRRKATFVFVDYIELLHCAPAKKEFVPCCERMSFVSAQLLNVARQMNTTVVGLSQLVCEKACKAYGVREIPCYAHSEQHADMVVALNMVGTSGERRLSVVKNREGKCSEIILHFDGTYQAFFRVNPVRV